MFGKEEKNLCVVNDLSVTDSDCYIRSKLMPLQN